MAKGTVIAELRQWRKEHGLTLEEAGARILVDGRGVDRATFHAWENGRKTPKDAWMFEIERVTGVQPNAFYRRPARCNAAKLAAAMPAQGALL